MANSVDPDQTAPIVCSGSTLFASILKFTSNVRELFVAEICNDHAQKCRCLCNHSPTSI